MSDHAAARAGVVDDAGSYGHADEPADRPSANGPDDLTLRFRQLREIPTCLTEGRPDHGARPASIYFRTLVVFARKARMGQGEVAAEVMVEYRRAADGTRQGEARSCEAVQAWMTPRSKTTPTKVDAAELYADALIAFDAWQRFEARPRRTQGTKERLYHSPKVETLARVASLSGIHSKRLSRACVTGELPQGVAVKRTRPKATWMIDLTECDRVSAGNAFAKIVCDGIRAVNQSSTK